MSSPLPSTPSFRGDRITGLPDTLVLTVGLDGSQTAYRAIDFAVALGDPQKDSLCCVHVHDQTASLKKDISEASSIAASRAGFKGKGFTFCASGKNYGESTKEAVLRLANENKTDILFLGSIGRKKESNSKHEVEVMGSVCDLSIRNSKASSVIVKHTAVSRKADEPRKILVAFDGSVAAIKALDLALRFAKQEDEVYVLLITDYLAFSSFFETRIDELIKTRGKKGRVHIAKKAGARPLADQILDFAERNGPMDFLFLGADGMGRTHQRTDESGKETPVLGSVADHCIRYSHCPVVVVKADPTYIFKIV